MAKVTAASASRLFPQLQHKTCEQAPQRTYSTVSRARRYNTESHTGHCKCCPTISVNNWHTMHCLHSRRQSVSATPDSSEAVATALENSCCNSYINTLLNSATITCTYVTLHVNPNSHSPPGQRSMPRYNKAKFNF